MIYEHPLEDRYELFCREYIKDFNQTEAVIRAGISNSKNRKAKTRLATNIMRRSDVRKRIDELLHISDEYYDNLRKRIITEQAAIAFCDMDETYDLKKMKLKDLKKIDGRLIKSTKQNKDGTFNVTLWDKQRALEFLGKHLGMINDVVDVNTKTNAINVYLKDDRIAKAIDDATKND